MEYSIQNLSKSKVEIAINVAKEEWEKDIKTVYTKNKYKYSLEGFRKGKVPMNVLVNRFGAEFFYEDATDEALNRCFSEIIEKDKLDIVGRPNVELQEVSSEGLKAVITVAIRPEFELGKYKGLTFKKQASEVTEEDINAVINKTLTERARMVEKDGEVANGDIITLDYSGSVDGVKFDGGTAEDQTLEIGSGNFIPGFEEQMVGMKKDESKDITVTFPKEYTPELAGKVAVFAVKVKEIKHKELPVFDDEFVKDIDDELNTVAEYKDKIAKELAPNKAKNAEYQLENEIFSTITDATEIDIPECMIEEELDYRLHELEQSMTQYGLKLADYLKYTGTSIEEMREQKKAEATQNIKTRLVMEALVRAEKIEVKPEEVSAKIEGLTDEEKTADRVNYEANQIVFDKLIAFLKENNTIE